MDLAQLLRKLGADEQAVQVLKDGTAQEDNSVEGRKIQAQCFYELCKIHAEKGTREEALQLLAKAKQITDHLLKKASQTEEMDAVKVLNTDIHVMIGDLAAQNGDLDNATKFYSKATTFVPNSELANQARLKLANAFRLKGEHAHAQGMCFQQFYTDKDNHFVNRV